MQIIGFEKEKEFLFSFDTFTSLPAQRKLFLEFFNKQVDEEFRFSKTEIKKLSHFVLSDIFLIKISVLLNVSFVHSGIYKPRNSKTNTTISFFKPQIQKFLSQVKMTWNILPSSYTNEKSAQKLIELVHGTKLTIMLKAQESFEQFILDKLLKDQTNRFIEQDQNTINIIPIKEEKVKIFPYWFFLEKNQLLIDEHIKKAVQCIKNTSYKHIYLVYPKCADFSKHIQLKIDEFEKNACREYEIKLIPYSLRSILR